MSSSIRFRILCLVAILFSGLARAAQVLSVDKASRTITISQRTSGDWTVDEGICVLHEWKEAACGTVIEASGETAKVKLKSGGEAAVGDFVQSAPTVKGGATAAPNPTVNLPKNVRVLHIYNQRLAATLEAGPNYAFPGVQYQVALDRMTCLGLTGGYWATSPRQATLNGFGGLVSVSFYQSRCYQGIWASLDAGAYLLKATTDSGLSENVNTIAGGLSVGYDARLSEHLVLRLGGGGRYLVHPHALTIAYDMDPWLYFFSGSLGWKF